MTGRSHNRCVLGPTLKAQQSERTKAALVAAGRQLFARLGYAGVSAEEVAAAAGVTTGAVYHQFGSKRGLFLAVFEAVEAELTVQIGAAAAAETEPWSGFVAAASAFVASATQPDIRQVVLIDGRSVLGWDEWHEVMTRYGLGMTRTVVTQLLEADLIAAAPIEPLTAAIFGALSEMALFVATAADPGPAAAESGLALTAFLNALRR